MNATQNASEAAPMSSAQIIAAQAVIDGREAKTEAVFNDEKVVEKICYLFSRWQDEREYEDIAEYGKALEPLFAAHGAKILRATKKPFGVVAEVDGAQYHYTVNSRSFGYKRIK